MHKAIIIFLFEISILRFFWVIHPSASAFLVARASKGVVSAINTPAQ